MNKDGNIAQLPTTGKSGDVLIVDDNKLITQALASLLRDAGYVPAVFHCGAEAIAYADRNTPAAAVIDIHLPDISGLILTNKLRQRFGDDVPIVVVSGDTSMETLGSLPHIGATYFFSKPVNGEHLVEQLREWTSAHQAPQPQVEGDDAAGVNAT